MTPAIEPAEPPDQQSDDNRPDAPTGTRTGTPDTGITPRHPGSGGTTDRTGLEERAEQTGPSGRPTATRRNSASRTGNTGNSRTTSTTSATERTGGTDNPQDAQENTQGAKDDRERQESDDRESAENAKSPTTASPDTAGSTSPRGHDEQHPDEHLTSGHRSAEQHSSAVHSAEQQHPQPHSQTFADPGTRLIATDLDGTLLRSDRTVSPRTVAALAAAERAGVEVFFVTGRPLRWMGVVAEHLAGHGLAILANGAGVYDLRAGTLIEAFPLPEADALAIAHALRAAHPETTFAVERVGGFRREPAYPEFEPDSTGAPSPVGELLAADRDQPVLKLLAHHPSAAPDEFLAHALALAGDRVEVTRSSPSALLEISGAGVSKATTLAKCCAERGITASEVAAFGDMPNDLAMLSWAGTSYAVANAHPHVRAATTHRTASNDEDGVAQVIERIVAARTTA